jgi:hypothetical protein
MRFTRPTTGDPMRVYPLGPYERSILPPDTARRSPQDGRVTSHWHFSFGPAHPPSRLPTAPRTPNGAGAFITTSPTAYGYEPFDTCDATSDRIRDCGPDSDPDLDRHRPPTDNVTVS